MGKLGIMGEASPFYYPQINAVGRSDHVFTRRPEFFSSFLLSTGKLTEERDLWGSAAYTLALKVTGRHSINTAKKLHLFEKAWAKLVRHFAIFLSEKDSIQVTVGD